MPSATIALSMVGAAALVAGGHWLYFFLFPERAERLEREGGYRPGPAREAYHWSQSLTAALLAAVYIWTLDFPEYGEAIRRTVEAGVVAVLLLWAYRKPIGEVGAPPVEEDEDERRRKPGIASLVALAGIAAVAWLRPFDEDGATWLKPYIFQVVGVAAAGFAAAWLWRWWNASPDERERFVPDVTLPDEAVLGALSAVAIVLFLLAVFIWVIG